LAEDAGGRPPVFRRQGRRRLCLGGHGVSWTLPSAALPLRA